MKFLVDAQLPRRIANWLNEEGRDVVPVVPKKEMSLTPWYADPLVRPATRNGC
jgi:hypothetical protein